MLDNVRCQMGSGVDQAFISSIFLGPMILMSCESRVGKEVSGSGK